MSYVFEIRSRVTLQCLNFIEMVSGESLFARRCWFPSILQHFFSESLFPWGSPYFLVTITLTESLQWLEEYCFSLVYSLLHQKYLIYFCQQVRKNLETFLRFFFDSSLIWSNVNFKLFCQLLCFKNVSSCDAIL